MNNELNFGRDSYADKRILELTSEGLSTREAKRKYERESRRKWKKIANQLKK